MTAHSNNALDGVIDLLAELPGGVLMSLSSALSGTTPGQWDEIRMAAARVVAIPRYREKATYFINHWQHYLQDVSPQAMAFALEAGGRAVMRERDRQFLELVWTGPGSGLPLRRTSQVLQDLIDQAQRELLIVSFAVYQIPEIVAALQRAAGRGVVVRLVVESPEESDGKIAFNALTQFGTQLVERASVYQWPNDQRKLSEQGRHGSLHAKCVVADRQTLFISSANLTHFALNLNMELGVLIRGGTRPQQVADHFSQLIERQILKSIGK